MSLSIHLLPEFGWTIGGRQMIGPGSVFQGRVELHLQKPLAMDRLRLVFRAQEHLKPYEIAPGIIRSKSNSLFSLQQTLWDSKDGRRSRDTGTHNYTFTIQMPMTQYPPSIDNKPYNCVFKLIAIVEYQQQQQYETVIEKDLVIYYMPFVETTLLKQPLITTHHESDLQVTTKLHSLDYVPGDSILGTITIDTKSATSTKRQLHVSLSLYQTVTNLHFTDVPDSTKLIASTCLTLSPTHVNISSTKNATYSSSLDLDLPEDLTPTFTYSKLSSITYRLRLSVKRKGSLLLWNKGLELDWPLTIGTLGAGIRSSSDLTTYNALENLNNLEQLTPKFMKAVEYEHALPAYEPSQLPDYQESFAIL